MAESANLLKALAENNVLQMVMFNDDSIEVQFKNHSFLLLSPCGANYQYHPPTCDGLKLVDSINTIRQRSKFATSETKAQVDIAMKARNLFATRPYLAAEFIHLCDGVVHLHQDVLEYVWPEIGDDQVGRSITQDQNGDII
uniref:C5orf34-like N-terminal domain-containing protein n=1 Tax=Ciona savignyi TaxID=51511 RepID=H2YSP4_CIOSA